MENSTINIPMSVNDMRIKHLPFLLKLNEFVGSEPGHKDICKMTAHHVGMDYIKLIKYPKAAVRNLFIEIADTFNTYKPEELPLSITYKDEDGKEIKYNFLYDFTRLPYEWFIDEKEIDFSESPIDLVSMCYIEDGFTYGQADEFDNVINPRSVRNRIFSENVPLSLFLNIQAFFLANWNVSQKYSELQALKRKAKNKGKRSHGNGKSRSTS